MDKPRINRNTIREVPTELTTFPEFPGYRFRENYSMMYWDIGNNLSHSLVFNLLDRDKIHSILIYS